MCCSCEWKLHARGAINTTECCYSGLCRGLFKKNNSRPQLLQLDPFALLSYSMNKLTCFVHWHNCTTDEATVDWLTSYNNGSVILQQTVRFKFSLFSVVSYMVN